jgi:hypothetical protein
LITAAVLLAEKTLTDGSASLQPVLNPCGFNQSLCVFRCFGTAIGLQHRQLLVLAFIHEKHKMLRCQSLLGPQHLLENERCT